VYSKYAVRHQSPALNEQQQQNGRTAAAAAAEVSCFRFTSSVRVSLSCALPWQRSNHHRASAACWPDLQPSGGGRRGSAAPHGRRVDYCGSDWTGHPRYSFVTTYFHCDSLAIATPRSPTVRSNPVTLRPVYIPHYSSVCESPFMGDLLLTAWAISCPQGLNVTVSLNSGAYRPQLIKFHPLSILLLLKTHSNTNWLLWYLAQSMLGEFAIQRLFIFPTLLHTAATQPWLVHGHVFPCVFFRHLHLLWSKYTILPTKAPTSLIFVGDLNSVG